MKDEYRSYIFHMLHVGPIKILLSLSINSDLEHLFG